MLVAVIVNENSLYSDIAHGIRQVHSNFGKILANSLSRYGQDNSDM